MVVTYGEALVDMIEMPDGRFAAALGGAVCNFSVAVARQQMAVRYLNPLSADSFGQRFAGLLARDGVQLGAAQASAQPTSLAIVTLDANRSPSYAFHRDGVADRDITPQQAIAALPAGLRLFHTGGLALLPVDLEATLEVMQAAAQRGALISVDANMRPLACADLPAYAAGVRRALAQAHLVKVSEEDLLHLGCKGDPVHAARTLLEAPNVKLVALTLGPDGAVLLTRSASVAVGAPAGIQVVDTVGCGDCFLAGLAASLQTAGVLGESALADAGAATLEQAARYAVASASLNAMREGCDPATAAEVNQFLQVMSQA